MSEAGLTARERAVALADPLLHAALAAAVVAPLVPRAGTGPVYAAVAAGTLIDLDHPVAARSLRMEANLSMPVRPPTHCLLVALGAAAAGLAAGGPVYGWAAFGGVASHLLRDAGDTNAPTPLLWPWAPARQIGAAWATAGSAALALGSWAVSRVAAAP